MLSFLPRNIKTIGCEHMNYFACPTYSRVIKRLRYKYLNMVVVLTERDKKNYSYLKSDKICVIPNALSFECSEIAKLQNKIILSVGGVSPEKGYDDLIDIAVELKKELPDWHLNIFGDGPIKDELNKKIIDKGVGDFVLLRGTTKDIKTEYLKSSIYVMTSKFEAFPMVLLEAQTCGLPVVSFNCNYGPSDIIEDGINGFLIPNRDTKLYINRVLQLAKNIELRIKYGKKAVVNSKKYTTTSILAKWEKLIQIIS